MHFSKVLLGLVSLSIVLAYPAMDRREDDGLILSKRFSKVPDQPAKKCKKASDCSCPKAHNSKAISSTSCVNGTCSCNNSAVNFAAGKFIDSAAAIGNAPVTKAVGQVMQTMADIKQVAPTVVGAIFGPGAKAVAKAAVNVIPDTGPSHIDQAAKGAAGKLKKAL